MSITVDVVRHPRWRAKLYDYLWYRRWIGLWCRIFGHYYRPGHTLSVWADECIWCHRTREDIEYDGR